MLRVNQLIGFGARRAAGAGAGHRYWRLLISAAANDANQTSIGEIEMRETVGGADATGSGTAAADSDDGTNVASRAFDNNSAVFWNSANTFPHWISYDFGTAKNIVQIAVTSRSTSTGENRAPMDFVLQYSDDNSSWTTVRTVSHQVGWGSVTPLTRLYGVADDMWRIKVSAVDGGTSCSIAEFEFRTSLGGADVATGGTVEADEHASTFVPDQAHDANTGTFWNANDETDCWVGYGWPGGGSVILQQVAIRARTTVPNQSPKDFKIQRSVDGGANWTDEWTVTGSTGWTSGLQRTFDR